MTVHAQHGHVSISSNEHNVSVQWQLNRMHFHPRIVRLAIHGLDTTAEAEHEPVLRQLLTDLKRQIEVFDPLLIRATVGAGTKVHDALLNLGFFETRRVLEPVLQLDLPTVEILSASVSQSADPHIDTIPLTAANDHEQLLDLLIQVYARTSRLDPATPERFERKELWSLFTDDIDWELSTCAYQAGELIGICAIHRGVKASEVELGLLGVLSSQLDKHSAVTLAMLGRSVHAVRATGISQLRAEIDTDDPWVLRTCAELPFRRAAESVSLALAPKWL